MNKDKITTDKILELCINALGTNDRTLKFDKRTEFEQAIKIFDKSFGYKTTKISNDIVYATSPNHEVKLVYYNV